MIGGGLIGTETAIWLAEQGHGVSLVEMLPEIMNGVAATDCMAYQERIAGAGMAVYTKRPPGEDRGEGDHGEDEKRRCAPSLRTQW